MVSRIQSATTPKKLGSNLIIKNATSDMDSVVAKYIKICTSEDKNNTEKEIQYGISPAGQNISGQELFSLITPVVDDYKNSTNPLEVERAKSIDKALGEAFTETINEQQKGNIKSEGQTSLSLDPRNTFISKKALLQNPLLASLLQKAEEAESLKALNNN